jgi:twitching motility protein PilU
VRQAPDVLLIGEMRDVESVRAAVYFAETGHLVLSSLHSNNSIQAIERTLGFFPSEIHEQILGQLSLNTRAIICQRLVPRKDGVGRIACIEIMIVNARMQELLSKGQLTQIKRELDQFLPDGMQSFDHALLDLVKADLITQEDAIRTSDNPNDMRLKLRTQPAFRQASQEPTAGYA